MHPGSVARRELLKSKLPSAELGKIWRLADTDRKVPCLQLMDSAAMVCSSAKTTLYNVEVGETNQIITQPLIKGCLPSPGKYPGRERGWMDSAAMVCSSVYRYRTDTTLYNLEGEGPNRYLLSL